MAVILFSDDCTHSAETHLISGHIAFRVGIESLECFFVQAYQPRGVLNDGGLKGGYLSVHHKHSDALGYLLQGTQ